MPRPLLLLLALAVPALVGAAPPAVEVFSSVDRRAVEVGGTVAWTVEALATVDDAGDRAALRAAFESADVGAQVGPALRVVERGGVEERLFGDVVQLRRRVVFEVVDPDVREVPAVRLDLGPGGEAWTRAQPLRAYAGGAAVARAARSVVSVTAEGAVGGVPFDRDGSAFLVGDDALVTAYHIVVGADRVRVRLPDGREAVTDRVWSLDPARDVAVLRVDPDDVRRAGLTPLALAPAEAAGDVAFTAGWAGRQQTPTAAARYADLVVAGGRVRLTANGVRPGDSGGPLLDERGRVLGVVTSGRSTGGDRDLLGAAVCLAADVGPALARRPAHPAPLADALAEAGGAAARVHAALGALGAPGANDPAPHLADLLAAVRDAPGDPALGYLAGTALDEGGAGDRAADVLRAAYDAGFTPAGYSLAHGLVRAGRLAEAADVFASLDGPYAPLGALGRAEALVAAHRYREAEADLRVVLDHDPAFAPALYLLGIVRIAQGRDAEAAALAVRMGARPDWADALRLPLRHPALGPMALDPLPRVPAYPQRHLAMR